MKYNKEKYLPFFAAKLLEKIPDVLMVSNTTKLLIALYKVKQEKVKIF